MAFPSFPDNDDDDYWEDDDSTQGEGQGNPPPGPPFPNSGAGGFPARMGGTLPGGQPPMPQGQAGSQQGPGPNNQQQGLGTTQGQPNNEGTAQPVSGKASESTKTWVVALGASVAIIVVIVGILAVRNFLNKDDEDPNAAAVNAIENLTTPYPDQQAQLQAQQQAQQQQPQVQQQKQAPDQQPTKVQTPTQQVEGTAPMDIVKGEDSSSNYLSSDEIKNLSYSDLQQAPSVLRGKMVEEKVTGSGFKQLRYSVLLELDLNGTPVPVEVDLEKAEWDALNNDSQITTYFRLDSDSRMAVSKVKF